MSSFQNLAELSNFEIIDVLKDKKSFFGVFIMKVKKYLKYINFNNAGSSKPLNVVNKEINSFLEIEKNYGGYYAVLKYKKLNCFYNNLSKLINCKPREISFLTSTTLA